MADLLDIVPANVVAAVWIDDQRLEVRALTVKEMVSILTRFPALITLIRGVDDDEAVPRLIIGYAESIGPIIAAACGHLRDETYEQAAERFLAHQQVKVLKAIKAVTFPNGLGSFVEDMKTLFGGMDEGTATKPIKMRSRRSRSASPPSSDEASHPTIQ
jgi:hypothetical protein